MASKTVPSSLVSLVGKLCATVRERPSPCRARHRHLAQKFVCAEELRQDHDALN